VGLPSFENASDKLHKPRPDTPAVAQASVRWMPVHGLLCAGYTEVLQQAGGFRERRRFWGEWTELNLRLWRMGLPTGYWMKGAHLRHWTAAPDSPTRNRAHKEREIVWGLLCTALEYDAGVDTPGSEAFWRLIASRYLPRLRRGLSAEASSPSSSSCCRAWARVAAMRPTAACQTPSFDFRPFQPLNLRRCDDVGTHGAALRWSRAAAGRWPRPRDLTDAARADLNVACRCGALRRLRQSSRPLPPTGRPCPASLSSSHSSSRRSSHRGRVRGSACRSGPARLPARRHRGMGGAVNVSHRHQAGVQDRGGRDWWDHSVVLTGDKCGDQGARLASAGFVVNEGRSANRFAARAVVARPARDPHPRLSQADGK
jgi:hypothetical protein